MTLLRFVHPLFHRRGDLSACVVCRFVWSRLERDKALMEDIRQGLADVEAGRTRPWSEIRRDL